MTKHVTSCDIRELAYVHLMEALRDKTMTVEERIEAARVLLVSTQDKHGETVCITMKESKNE